MREQTIQLRAKGVRVLGTKLTLLKLVLRVAAAVSPCELELVADRPRQMRHDVRVEKAGSDMLLIVGDRGVRLEKHDARHLGELLSANWAGGLGLMRADDPRLAGDCRLEA